MILTPSGCAERPRELKIAFSNPVVRLSNTKGFEEILLSFEPDEVLESFAAANRPERLSGFDQDLGGAGAEVVVGRHREPVGAVVADGEDLALGRLRQGDVAGEEVGVSQIGPTTSAVIECPRGSTGQWDGSPYRGEAEQVVHPRR
jgi:hypothetical protein